MHKILSRNRTTSPVLDINFHHISIFVYNMGIICDMPVALRYRNYGCCEIRSVKVGGYGR